MPGSTGGGGRLGCGGPSPAAPISSPRDRSPRTRRRSCASSRTTDPAGNIAGSPIPEIPMNATDLVDRTQLRDDIPEFTPGDTLKVHVRVVEGNRERVQVF